MSLFLVSGEMAIPYRCQTNLESKLGSLVDGSLGP